MSDILSHTYCNIAVLACITTKLKNGYVCAYMYKRVELNTQHKATNRKC